MAPKKKQEKMALGDFLTNQSLGSWADEMDGQPIPSATPGYGGNSRDAGGERRAFTQPAWGEARGERSGGGMGDRGTSYGGDRPSFSNREVVEFPTKPPYTAHLGNLDYNVTSTDIEGFFADCQVTSVRLVEDTFDRKPKGFGYVEFASPEGLRQALTKSESSFMGRNVKISVADPPKGDRTDSSRDLSDWSRKGPLPDLPSNSRQGSNRGFGRNFDNMSDTGSERGGPGGRKPAFADDGKVRDFSNWERRGPLSPAPQSGPPMRDGGRLRDAGAPRERMSSPAWGEGKSDAGSRPPRREFEPRPERAPTAAESDSQWRSKMRPDAVPDATSAESAPASPSPEAPKERPRLNLAKRTVSTAEPESASTTPSESKASPFGAARPIDTATREREIDEKRELAVRQKKEADDKAREEKTARDVAARTARAERADRGQNEQENGDKATPPTGDQARGARRPSRQQPKENGAKAPPKENGDAPAQARPSFSILSREADDVEGGDGAGERDAVDASANGDIVDDKETKPKEVTVALDSASSSDPTAQAMQDDGWSTVSSAKTKTKGRAGGRALAS